MSRGRQRPRLRRAPAPIRFLRSVVGAVLLLAALYLAVRVFGDPAWAIPTVVALAALIVLLMVLTGQRRLRRRRTLGRMITGSPTDFEETVARMMRSQGFHGVRRTGGAGDLAADVVATDRAGRTVVVQCKRYGAGRAVGSKELQTFIGMQRIHHQADYGLYVTTSSFTRPAQDLAERHGVTLVDGAALTAALTGGQRATWMRR